MIEFLFALVWCVLLAAGALFAAVALLACVFHIRAWLPDTDERELLDRMNAR